MASEKMTLDIAAARQDMLAAGDELIAEHLEVGAVALECTNMVPFATRAAASCKCRSATSTASSPGSMPG